MDAFGYDLLSRIILYTHPHHHVKLHVIIFCTSDSSFLPARAFPSCLLSLSLRLSLSLLTFYILPTNESFYNPTPPGQHRTTTTPTTTLHSYIMAQHWISLSV
jgi:hypothetical protein